MVNNLVPATLGENALMTFTDCHRSHQNCIMCGVDNPQSLGVKFEPVSGNVVSSCFTGSDILQGYTGYLHGGIISALLDCAMVHCLFHRGIVAVTTDLNVKFRQRIRYDAELEITGELKSSRYGLHKLCSSITENGEILAEADARFFKVDDL